MESRKAGVGVGSKGESVGEELNNAEVLAPFSRAEVGVRNAGVLVGVKDKGDVGEGEGDTVPEGVDFSNSGVEVCVREAAGVVVGRLGEDVKVDSSNGEGVPTDPRLKAPAEGDTGEDGEPTSMKEGDWVRVESVLGEKEGREDWEALGVMDGVRVESNGVGVEVGV